MRRSVCHGVLLPAGVDVCVCSAMSRWDVQRGTGGDGVQSVSCRHIRRDDCAVDGGVQWSVCGWLRVRSWVDVSDARAMSAWSVQRDRVGHVHQLSARHIRRQWWIDQR